MPLGEAQEQQADVAKTQSRRRLANLLGDVIAEEFHRQGEGKRRDDARVGVDMMLLGEVDAPDAIAVAFEAHDVVAGADRGARYRSLERLDDLAVSIARIEEAAVDVGGLLFRE